jgi:hypothetical protein
MNKIHVTVEALAGGINKHAYMQARQNIEIVSHHDHNTVSYSYAHEKVKSVWEL